MTQSKVEDTQWGAGPKAPRESGFPDRAQSTLAFDDGTRTFTITPVGSAFEIWQGPRTYIIDSARSIQIPDSEGLHFIYFDNGALTSTQIFSIELITEFAICAVVYWDADNNEAILFGDERHGTVMDSRVHAYLHLTAGAAYESGLQITNLTVDQNGDDPEDAQCGVADGVIWDEDIQHVIVDGAPQALSPIAQIPLFYRSGASGVWRRIAATDYPITTAGTGRAAWNEWTGSTWQLTEITNNDWACTHLIATGDINHPIIGIVGQAEYSSLSDVRDGAEEELAALQLGALTTLSPEFRAIATLVFQTNSAYANAVKSAIVSNWNTDGDEYISWLDELAAPGGASSIPGGGGGVTDHGALTGLSDDDHPQYGLLDSAEVITGQWTFDLSIVARGGMELGDADEIVFGADSDWIQEYNAAFGALAFDDALGGSKFLVLDQNTVVFEVDNSASQVGVTNGYSLRVEDATGNDWVDIQHNGTDLLFTPTNTGKVTFGAVTDFYDFQSNVGVDADLSITGGGKLQVFNAAGTAYLEALYTGTDIALTGINTGTISIDATNIELDGAVAATGDLTVPDEAYGVSWNGSLEVPTKNAVYDKIETLGGGGSGDVTKVGTPVSTQVGVWTGDGTLAGYANLLWNNGASTFVVNGAANVTGNVGAGSLTVTDDAYGAGWNGSAQVPTKNAVYDKIESLSGGSGPSLWKAKGNLSSANFRNTENVLSWNAFAINGGSDITLSGSEITCGTTGVYKFTVTLRTDSANRTELFVRTYIDTGSGKVQDTDEIVSDYVSRDTDQNTGAVTLSTALSLTSGDVVEFRGFGDCDGTCVGLDPGTILLIEGPY
jgi:hypothetical protein